MQSANATPAGTNNNASGVNSIASLGNSNLFKAYRTLLLNKLDMKSFEDNCFLAFTLLERDHGGSGVKGFAFLKLVKMLGVEFPTEVVSSILQQLYKREEENVEFEEFLAGIKTVLLYDNYFEEVEPIFRHLDKKKRGKILTSDLLDAVRKLKGEEIA